MREMGKERAREGETHTAGESDSSSSIYSEWARERERHIQYMYIIY